MGVMDDDQRPRDLRPDTGQQPGSREGPEGPEVWPRTDPAQPDPACPDPPPDRAGWRPVGVDEEHPADAEHYDSEHYEPL